MNDKLITEDSAPAASKSSIGTMCFDRLQRNHQLPDSSKGEETPERAFAAAAYYALVIRASDMNVQKYEVQIEHFPNDGWRWIIRWDRDPQSSST